MAALPGAVAAVILTLLAVVLWSQAHEDAHLHDAALTRTAAVEVDEGIVEGHHLGGDPPSNANPTRTSTAGWERTQQAVRDLEEERERYRSDVAELRHKLSQMQASEVDRNVPILRLAGEEARTRGGRPFVLELVPDARRVVLMVEVVDPEPYDEYGVRIVAKDGGTEVWSGGGLTKPGAMLRLGLPASLLELGPYEVVIYGIRGREKTDLADSYLLEVVR